MSRTALKKEGSPQGRPVTCTTDAGEEGASNAYASAFQDSSDVKTISAMAIKGEERFQSAL